MFHIIQSIYNKTSTEFLYPHHQHLTTSFSISISNALNSRRGEQQWVRLRNSFLRSVLVCDRAGGWLRWKFHEWRLYDGVCFRQSYPRPDHKTKWELSSFSIDAIHNFGVGLSFASVCYYNSCLPCTLCQNIQQVLSWNFAVTASTSMLACVSFESSAWWINMKPGCCCCCCWWSV